MSFRCLDKEKFKEEPGKKDRTMAHLKSSDIAFFASKLYYVYS